MTQDAYKDALDKAKAELVHAVQQRERWVLEVARLEQLVKALSTHVDKIGIAPDLPATNVGLTDVVLSLINQSGDAMTPARIKDALIFFGYDLTRYANPMAMVHQTLKRLAEQGKIRDMGDGTYRRGALYDALIKKFAPKPLFPTTRAIRDLKNREK